MRRFVPLPVLFAAALSSAAFAQKPAAKPPRDSATVAFAWRISKLADSAAIALEFISDSALARFVDIVTTSREDKMMRASGIASEHANTTMPFSFVTLSGRAAAAEHAATPLIDAFEANDAPSGMDHLQDEMVGTLRAAATAASSVSRNAFPCEVSTELCADSLPVALTALKTQLDAYIAARVRTVAALGAHGVSPP